MVELPRMGVGQTKKNLDSILMNDAKLILTFLMTKQSNSDYDQSI